MWWVNENNNISRGWMGCDVKESRVTLISKKVKWLAPLTELLAHTVEILRWFTRLAWHSSSLETAATFFTFLLPSRLEVPWSAILNRNLITKACYLTSAISLPPERAFWPSTEDHLRLTTLCNNSIIVNYKYFMRNHHRLHIIKSHQTISCPTFSSFLFFMWLFFLSLSFKPFFQDH